MMVNGVCVVHGEANAVVALLKKFRRNLSHLPALDDHDPLLRNFADLRDVLNSITDLSEMNSKTFLSPFLEVIKSEATDCLVTSRALAAIDKFINCGLLSSNSIRMESAVQSVAEAVTKAKFVGTSDTASDECVLYQILQTLRSLLLFSGGFYLTDETVCEILQCCFRIGLESSLSELLRMAAESALTDMTRLLFTRLFTFEQNIRHPYIRKLVMKARGDKGYKKKKMLYKDDSIDKLTTLSHPSELKNVLSDPKTTPLIQECTKNDLDDVVILDAENSSGCDTDGGNRLSPKPSKLILSTECQLSREAQPSDKNSNSKHESFIKVENLDRFVTTESLLNAEKTSLINVAKNFLHDKVPTAVSSSEPSSERCDTQKDDKCKVSSIETNLEQPSLPPSGIPHGLPCVRELLRFLIALTNPQDRSNSNSMIFMGLNLLTIALEAGAGYFGSYPVLLPLVKNEMCKSLLRLLDHEKLQIFTAVNRVCFLLFESLRTHLKFQLECYFLKLKSIITSEQTKLSYELKEMALESLVVLWRIPGLVTELYLNYDCGLYCSNLFEDLTRLLLQNAFPLGGLCSTHILSLDALLAVVETIERNCVMRQTDVLNNLIYEDSNAVLMANKQLTDSTKGLASFSVSQDLQQHNGFMDNSLINGINQVRFNRIPVSSDVPSMSEIIDCKKRKKIVIEGTELFNLKPDKGIEFLSEKGILSNPLKPDDVALWLRNNSCLDKNKIADYICNRKNFEVLKSFVNSFDFKNLRLDEALRKFLETFRLPGDSAEISKIMQHFSEHWFNSNNQPFNDVDAAFTLSYGVIMLNVDQHNPQVRRLQPPMNFESFKKNLSGTNKGENFDVDMLEKMYNAIKSEEIVMPAEQTGSVKENYLWKVLLKRGETKEGVFLHTSVGWNDHDLFTIIWGSATAALSYVFDKSHDESILTKSLTGYRKCASIAAYYGMTNVFDNLIIHLCKFSTLMTSTEDSNQLENAEHSLPSLKANSMQSLEAMTAFFAEDKKAQMAAKTMFHLVHKHGDNLREGWKNVLDCVLHLFKAHLLPPKLVKVECFIDPKGFVSIQRAHAKTITHNKQETSIFSWLGFGASSDTTQGRRPSLEQKQLFNLAKSVVVDCHPEQLITDSKYLTSSALGEFMGSIVHASQQIASAHSSRDHSEISGTAESGGEDSTTTVHSDRQRLSVLREDCVIFLLELTISIVLENRDRLMQIWPDVKSHLHFLLTSFDHNPLICERAMVGLLRVASRNLFRLNDDEKIAEEMLQSLVLLLQLRPPASEEIGVRAVQLVSKILLYHLTALSKAPSFMAIIKQLLLFMESYIKAGESELLSEAIPESLKNIILVLDNSGLLCKDSDLYNLISTQMSQFLPEIVAEVMHSPPFTTKKVEVKCSELEKNTSQPTESVFSSVDPERCTTASAAAIKALSMDDLRFSNYAPSSAKPSNDQSVCAAYSNQYINHSGTNAMSLPNSPVTVAENAAETGQFSHYGLTQYEIPELMAVVVDRR